MKNKTLGVTITAIFTFCALGFSASAEHCTARINPQWEQLLHKYRHDDSVKHLIFVQCLGEESKANVQIYEKNDAFGSWSIIKETDGLIGRCGSTPDKREGDGKTPEGDFGIISAFGINPNPGSALPYLDVTDDLYAVDSESEYYNRIVSADKCSEGEHLIEYSPEYNYALFLDYNKECVYGLGSAIFFHCKGPKNYTGGCVAVDEDVMKMILERFTPADRVCIFTLSAE